MKENFKEEPMNHEIQYILFDKRVTDLAIDLTEAKAGRILEFHEGFPHYVRTPLVALSALAKSVGVAGISVKDESARFGLNAFKGLGGSYAMGRVLARELGLPDADPTYERIMRAVTESGKTRTFVTATDGNHGRGVAWAATVFGQKSVVYMPKNSSLERLENIKKAGAHAEILDLNYDDTVRYAHDMAETNGWTLIQDTAWPGYEEIPAWILQGYMTMAYEAELERRAKGDPRPTHLFLQVGVGSMAAAVAGFMHQALGDSAPRIILVEPKQADCLYRTAKADDRKIHIVQGDLNTIMAGLACGEPSPPAWEILRSTTDAFLSCDDEVARIGMRALANPKEGDEAVVSGESGAPGLGAFLRIMTDETLAPLKEALGIGASSSILCFSTEGDTDKKSYDEIVAQPQ